MDIFYKSENGGLQRDCYTYSNPERMQTVDLIRYCCQTRHKNNSNTRCGKHIWAYAPRDSKNPRRNIPKFLKDCNGNEFLFGIHAHPPRFFPFNVSMHGHDCSWPKADDPHKPVIETWEFRCPKYDKIIQAVTEHGTIRFLPMKAPLKKCYSCLIPKENLFDTQTLLEKQKLSLIINLTKFRDLQDPQDFADAKCLMMWLPLSFDKPPSDYKVKKFIKQVNTFAEKHDDCLIGLHCMNGVNQTGFMIVSFLVEKCHISLRNAVNDFANARGAGIYRKDFLEELECRYANNKRVLTVPMKPDWVTDRARLPIERQKRMGSLWRTYSVHNISAFPGEFPIEFNGDVTHEMGELYQLCGQTEAKNWDEVIKGRKCEKIGEGGFAEVYLFNNKEDAPVILKEKETNGDAMSTVNDIEPELAITKGLSDLGVLQEYVYQAYFTTTFVKHTGYDIVQGEYDPDLLKAWNAYDRVKISENESPSVYGKDPLQLYIVFSAEHAGQPLEDFLKKDFNSINPRDRIDISSSIFYQTAYALAVAEQFGAFEHRDLHVSNILIKSFTAGDDVNTIRYRIDGCDYELNPHGFEVKIIDYTLSRMRIDDNVYFADIGKQNIFNGAENDPQANTYREMRDATKCKNEECVNCSGHWEVHTPSTNIMWLQYLLTILLRKTKDPKGLLKIKQKLKNFATVNDFLLSTDEDIVDVLRKVLV